MQQFLSVDVKSDREQYQPREEGTLFISTKDANGKPVAAEIALGLFDESVRYIQRDYAGDPRQFYYGTKRGNAVQTQSTFNQKAYARLVEGQDKRLVDAREMAQRAEGAKDDEEESRDGSYSRLQTLNKLERRPSGALASPTAGAVSLDAVSESVIVTRSGEYGRNAGAAQKSAEANAPAPPPEQQPAVVVRNDFRSTILWQPDIKTDADGTATVKVKYPDSLTTGWPPLACYRRNQFGIGNASTRTKPIDRTPRSTALLCSRRS